MAYNKRQMLEDNISAIRVAFQLQKEKRKATDQETTILSKYSGFGGLKMILRSTRLEDKGTWPKSEQPYFELVRELKYALIEGAGNAENAKIFFQGLQSTITDAFYTPAEIPAAIKNVLSTMDITPTKVLDPSAGNGAFLKPFIEKETQYLAIEKDAITSLILAAQYGNVQGKGYEEIGAEYNNHFDLVTSNIPFGQIKVFDPTFLEGASAQQKSLNAIHNYFFVKALDNVKDGGLIAFVTSQGFANAPTHEDIRRYILSSANLVSATRLPNKLFSDTANTEVGTDLIILQKNSNKASKALYVGDKQVLKPNEELFVNTLKDREISTNALLVDEQAIYTEKEYGKNMYGQPGINYYHNGTVTAVAAQLNEKLIKDFTNNFDKQLYESRDKEIAIEQVEQIPLVNIDDIVEENVITREVKEKQIDLFSSQELEQQVNQEVNKYKYEKKVDLSPKTMQPFPEWQHLPENSLVVYIKDGNFHFGHISNIREEEVTFSPIESFDDSINNKISKYLQIRDTYNDLVEQEGSKGKEFIDGRRYLNTLYDEFINEFGSLNNAVNKNFLSSLDKQNIPSILGLELIDRENKETQYSKADIFYRPINIYVAPTSIDTAQEALASSLNKYGNVDIEFISDLLDKNIDETTVALQPYVLYNPITEQYESKEVMLSGNIYEKIDEIQDKLQRIALTSEIQRTLTELHSVIPERISFEDIDIDFGERWIDSELYSRFASQLMDSPIRINYAPSYDTYEIACRDKYTTAIRNDFFVRAKNRRQYDGIDMLEMALYNNIPTITYTKEDSNGEKIKYTDAESMQIIGTKIEQIKSEFVAWMHELPIEEKNRIVEQYNKTFNCFVKAKWDGTFQEFPDLSYENLGIKDLYDTQKNAVWMLKNNKGGIIDHEVGGGKTLIMCVAANEMKRLGIVNKPMIIGIKANVDEIYKTYKKAYPNAKILYPQKGDYDAKNREQFLNQIKNNNWDCVFLSHDQFLSIPQDEKIEQSIIREELDELDEAINVFRRSGGNVTSQALRGLENKKKNLIVDLQNITYKINNRTDNVPTFKELGIDHLFVDESHNFKNLMYTTKHTRVAGLNTSKGSQRALDIHIAVRTLQDRAGKDLQATYLSGTTISNSLTELYVLFKTLRPNALKKQGIYSFDAWAAMYCRKTSDYEMSVTNQVQLKERFRHFVKVPELAMFYSEITDYKTADDIGVQRPEGRYILMNIPQTRDQREYTKRLVAFAKGGSLSLLDENAVQTDGKEKARMLLATNYSRKMSLDMRMISSEYDDDPNSKISICAKKVAEYYNKFDLEKGTQFIFTDIGTYKKNEWTVVGDLKRKLVEDYGIPGNEIRFIQEGTTEKKKDALIKDMNDGKIRVLMGSTSMLGTGVNAQQRAVAVHHIDIPWRPSDLEQRDGRAKRAGNEIAKIFADNKVDIITYAVEKSLDAYKFNLLQNKQLFITQLKQNTPGTRTIDEGTMDEGGGMNYAEYVAVLSGNTDLLEKTKIDKKITSLESERKLFLKTKTANETLLQGSKEEFNKLSSRIEQLKSDYEEFNRHKKYDDENKIINELKINSASVAADATVDERGAYLNELFDSVNTQGEYKKIGDLYGFPILIKTQPSENDLFHFTPENNRMFIGSKDAEIKYSYNNGIISRVPKTAMMNFYNAIEKIPAMIERYQLDYEKLEKKIPELEALVSKEWHKVEQLQEAKGKSRELDVKIQAYLASDGNNIELEEPTEEVFEDAAITEEIEYEFSDIVVENELIIDDIEGDEEEEILSIEDTTPFEIEERSIWQEGNGDTKIYHENDFISEDSMNDFKISMSEKLRLEAEERREEREVKSKKLDPEQIERQEEKKQEEFVKNQNFNRMEKKYFTFDELKQKISIIELAEHYGYVYQKGDGVNIPMYRHELGDKIGIFNPRDNYTQRYFSVYDNAAKGSLYNFVVDKVSLGIIPNPLSPPHSSDNNRVVNAVLHNYLNVPLEIRQENRKTMETFKTYKQPEKIDFATRIVPLEKDSELQMRGLNSETLNDPLFKGRLYNAKYVGQENVSYRIALPIYDFNENIIGCETKSMSSGSKFMAGSQKAKGVWHSNIPEKIEAVVITESPIDALSYHQLKGNANILYVATGGNLCTGQMETLHEILKVNSDRIQSTFEYRIATDNDYIGCHYGMDLTQYILNNSNSGVTMDVIPLDKLKEDYNANVKGYVLSFKELTDKVDFLSKLEQQIKEDPNGHTISIDTGYNDKMIQIAYLGKNIFSENAVNNALIQSLPQLQDIKIEKSIMKDWNEDVALLKHVNEKYNLRLNYKEFEGKRERFMEDSTFFKQMQQKKNKPTGIRI